MGPPKIDFAKDLNALIKAQRFDGSFDIPDEVFADIAAKIRGEYELGSDEVVLGVCAALFALSTLKACFADKKSQWVLVYKKGIRWLKKALKKASPDTPVNEVIKNYIHA